MIAAVERIETGDRTICEADDRLVKDGDFIAFKRAAQIGFHRQPIGFSRPHRVLEYVDTVAAGALGVVHREFGILEHVFGVLRFAAAECEPHRSSYEYLAVTECNRGAQRLATVLSKRGNAGG